MWTVQGGDIYKAAFKTAGAEKEGTKKAGSKHNKMKYPTVRLFAVQSKRIQTLNTCTYSEALTLTSTRSHSRRQMTRAF